MVVDGCALGPIEGATGDATEEVTGCITEGVTEGVVAGSCPGVQAVTTKAQITVQRRIGPRI